MPRDINGNFTLDPSNPVVAGTVIEIGWANPTLVDIAAALTDSLSRSGSGGMLVPFRFADGTVAAPGIAFTNEPSSGFYRAGLNDIRVSVGAADVMKFAAAGVTIQTKVVTPLVQSAVALTLQSLAGAIVVNAAGGEVQPSGDNTIQLGDAAHRWSTGFFGTSVVTPLLGTAGDTQQSFQINGTTKWAIGNSATNFALLPVPDNSIDIGATALRVRNGYFGTSVLTPVVSSSGSADLSLGVNAGSALVFIVRQADGAFAPILDNTRDIGDATHRIRNGYFGTSVISSLVRAPSGDLLLDCPAGQGTILGAAGAYQYICTPGQFYPASDNSRTLGTAGQRWSAVYALNYIPAFESAEFALTAGPVQGSAHGLGRVPKGFQAILRCKTAEFGYAIGDELEAPSTSFDSINCTGIAVFVSVASVGFTMGNQGITITNAGSGVRQVLTNANWKVVLRAW